MLQLTNLTDGIVSSLPIPWSLDPDVPGSLIHRTLALLALLTSTILLLIHVPPYCLSLVIQPSSFILIAVGSWLICKPVPNQLHRRCDFSCIPAKNTCLYMAALLLFSTCMAQANHCLQLLHAIQTFYKLSKIDHHTFAPLDTSQLGGVSFEFGWPPMLRLVLFTVQLHARAMMALADFFEELEKLGEGANLGATAHLGRTFGNNNRERTIDEILKFLRCKGVNIPQSYLMD
ncbi:hypothetical protein F5146DRAFT_999196 [Armillaria mellea]|nr:hypothetical protein F5146DRAFT_999196 [Armillaria mellea]